MKIGIISMQRVVNYGSFLQAYSLRKVLRDLGYDVTFVDYRPGPVLGGGNQVSGLTRILKKVGIDEVATVLLHVGRFDRVKNHEFLIDTFNDYTTRNPSSIMLLVGEGGLSRK